MVPSVSIVLITCNRAESAMLSIASLLVQQLPQGEAYELVIVNDGSKDGTAHHLDLLVESAGIPIRVVTTPGVGVPGARNLGARAAQSSWVACFDDDQIASPGWLEALVAVQRTSGARCVGGALRLQFPDGAAPALGPRARRILGEHLVAESDGLYPADALPASNNVLIARDLLLGLNGFDENFRQGGSDTELFERVRAAGEPIWFAANALAYHVIPEHRLAPAYFRWVGLKVGAAQARILLKRGKQRALATLLAKRVAAVALRDLPLLARHSREQSPAARLDVLCSLWFTQGLARGCAAHVWPHRRFAQRFLDFLDFRRHHGERASDI